MSAPLNMRECDLLFTKVTSQGNRLKLKFSRICSETEDKRHQSYFG